MDGNFFFDWNAYTCITRTKIKITANLLNVAQVKKKSNKVSLLALKGKLSEIQKMVKKYGDHHFSGLHSSKWPN